MNKNVVNKRAFPKNGAKNAAKNPPVAPAFFRQEKEPKPKLLGPDIFGRAGGLPRERVGAKKFGMSLETQGAPEKFEKNKVCVQCWFPNMPIFSTNFC